MLLQMETLKAIAEREIDRQTPNADAAIEHIRRHPEEMRKIDKALDQVVGKGGHSREEVNEIVSTLMKQGVKKGKRIILNTDSSTDHPTFSPVI